MNNYVQRLGLTAWRKKTTILLSSGLLILMVYGLRYSRLDDNFGENKEERDAQVVAEALMRSINVKFIQNANKLNEVSQNSGSRVIKGVPPNVQNKDYDFEKRMEMNFEGKQFENMETEQQLGIPYVNLDEKKPYVPKQRLVHLDLKGAPPTINYLKKFFPLIKTMGATGVLLEYEDMFPFGGPLKNISAKNAYTVDQIKEILNLAQKSRLEVIPLVQTFGHVEFALKHAEFSNIREVPGSPQALCPSRNAALDFIRELIGQVMSLHPTIKYLHIGCDEVFQMGECDLCRLELHENLFLKHVKNVASIVRQKYPSVRIIIWDDMLRHLSTDAMIEMKLGDLVEPMVWVYAEDIYRFVQPGVWEKYALVFRTAWTASAFKGAFGETLYVPNARRHLENNLKWLDVMTTQSSAFKEGLSGIAITGWQRYDHFAVLCELLPASLPSLALALLAATHGYFNSSLRNQFLASLSCPENSVSTPFINLDSDPFLWEKLSRCTFPGNTVFRLTNRLHNTEIEAREFLDIIRRQKGWMTSYSVRHNYSLPLRVDELTVDLPRMYHGMTSFARATVDAMTDIFDNYTISEWIEQKIYPFVHEFELLQNQSVALKSVNQWPSRPLPPLPDLQRLGIGVNVN